jgi:DNA polymerase-3 subunit alpha
LGSADSCIKLKKLIQKSKELGHRGCAITDHEILGSHFKALKISKELEFPVILGNEIYLMTPEQDEYLRAGNKAYFPHFILLALDEIGHYQLRQLTTRAWLQSYSQTGVTRRPTLTTDIEEVIGEDRGHLVASSACLGSYFAHETLSLIKLEGEDLEKNAETILKLKKKIFKFLKWCINTFGAENFYIEIQPATEEQWEQIAYNKRAIEIAKACDIPFIVTTDSHYIGKSQAKIHEAFLQSKDAEREVASFYKTAHLMSETEVREYLKPYHSQEDINTAIENTDIIGNRVKEYSLSHSQIVPLITLPKFTVRHLFKKSYNKYEYIKAFAYSEGEQDRYLLYQIENRMEQLFDLNNCDIELDRINKELKELKLITEALNQPIAGYYNTMQKIIELCWAEGDSLVGCGRGSTGGFFIAYLLEIMQINPIPLGDLMPYWRHISAERGLDLPDIDFDTETSRRKQILQAMRDYFGEFNVINVCTYGTLSGKTAILVSARGLGISNDDATYLTSLIPIERGEVWTLHDCLFGNVEKNRVPVKELINELEEYGELKETALELEGLIVQRGIHASGVLILNENYTKYNCAMRSPSGEITTQFELHDSEAMSALKYDFLSINALDRIRKTIDLLIEEGHIEWQGSLKKTYDTYFHPEVLDYDDIEMWERVSEVPSLFQFDSLTGAETIKNVKPRSAVDLTNANNLMRLMADANGNMPLDLYVKYKNNINLWFTDMLDYGLNSNEIDIMKSHLLTSYGLADSQEKVMILSMSPYVSGFSLKEANKLRKSIAKKRFDILQEAKKMFFEKGRSIGTRDILLQYVWDEVFSKSFGYSFSSIHSYEYSVIAVQEMNIYNKYHPIYWNTGCLIIDSASDEDNDNNKSTDYGKMATAIGNMKQTGITVALPDLNTTDFGFKPDVDNNRILFGLKGIHGIGDEVVQLLLKYRPYSSFNDFYERMVKTSLIKEGQTIQLIKAGCFDELEQKDRKTIMKNFIKIISEPKTSLNMQNFKKLVSYNLIPENKSKFLDLSEFKNLITKNIYEIVPSNKPDAKKKYSDRYLLVKNDLVEFFNENFSSKCIVEDIEKGIVISENKFNKEYDSLFEDFKSWLKSPQLLRDFNNAQFYEIWNNKCSGTLSSWEMSALSYYNGEHELINVDTEKYGIVDFFELPEQPQIIGCYYTKTGKKRLKFRLDRIVGTVLDRNKLKHVVTLLTPQGVVNIKFNSGNFGFYNKQISQSNGDGTKTILEKSFFTRGNKILVNGYRYGSTFRPYKYVDSIWSHSLCLIESINEDGSLELQTERRQVNNDE